LRKLEYFLATEKDESILRSILKKTPMDGSIIMTFEREPSFFAVRDLEGPFHQTIAVRDKNTNEIFGITNRSVREYFFNGTVKKVGYLGLLRMLKGYQTGFPTIMGYKFVRELHKDKKVDFYFTSIMENNLKAQRLLNSGHRDLPRYQKYTRFCTYTVPIGKTVLKTGYNPEIIIKSAKNESNKKIIEYLNTTGKDYQFFPYWTEDTLFNPQYTPYLYKENFFLAYIDDQLVGCMAIWDQRDIKQMIVRGYGKNLKYMGWFYNLFLKLKGFPSLPKLNTAINSCYISLLAIKNNEKEVFTKLFESCYNILRKNKIEYLMLGLSDLHPLNQIIIKKYTLIPVYSDIYLVSWDDGFDPITIIDARPPGIDIALL